MFNVQYLMQTTMNSSHPQQYPAPLTARQILKLERDALDKQAAASFTAVFSSTINMWQFFTPQCVCCSEISTYCGEEEHRLAFIKVRLVNNPFSARSTWKQASKKRRVYLFICREKTANNVWFSQHLTASSLWIVLQGIYNAHSQF